MVIDAHNASNLDGSKSFTYGNKTGIAENIIVSNCILQSLSAGIRVGYGKGNMRNLMFSNIIIHESNGGILIHAREEGSIDQVLFENLIIKTKHQGGSWWGRGELYTCLLFRLVKESTMVLSAILVLKTSI